MALRAVAAAPCSGSLGSVRSSKPFTPKVRACLEIVRGVLERGEQVVIFSPFHDPLDVLSGYLGAAGIPHDVLDGRMSQKERAHLAMEFKRGLMRNSILYPQSSILAKPVLLAGLKACAEGYSWHLCNNVILFTFDWALDLMRQAVDRCHRINSVKPVHVWSIIVDGTIECKLAAMLDAKGGAADTALDGEQGRAGSPMPAVGTIPGAQGTDRPTFVDEDTCLAAWPRLCQELANAWNSSQAEKKLAA
jgi:SNF2 family DNA or RNA helicase